MHRGIAQERKLVAEAPHERPGFRKAVKSSDRRRRRKELLMADKENTNSLNLSSARDLEVRNTSQTILDIGCNVGVAAR